MPPSDYPTELPIDALLPELLNTLDSHPVVLLQAPPGAGKTTRVPPALLDAPWLDGQRVVMLEPRRLAARAAARFMARERGETVGGTIGFRTRLETRVSNRTRIEVVTEGVLVRMLQHNPALSDYAALLFDEFHERSLNADLALALARESQQALREDLRIVVMSATLDSAPLARLLDDAPVMSSAGRGFPVTVEYHPPRREQTLPEAVAAAVLRALEHEPGSLLVFLPGAGEIRAVAERLADRLPDDVYPAPLHGMLDPAAQDAAIAPASPGKRKLVLATAIAQTSLTIEGVRVVIDAGLERRAVFDPPSGMTGLITTRVSRAAAEQRRGRAGRIEPGVCHRLWSEAEQQRLAAFTPPEILAADLAPLVLELARWGVTDPSIMTWLDPPPPAHWNQARDLLEQLAALDDSGRITAHGRAMLDTGVHPRLAQLLIRARALKLEATAAALAALLSDRDVAQRGTGSDLEPRLAALAGEPTSGMHRGRLEQARKLARRLAGNAPLHRIDPTTVGRLLALAYPDRIARRRPGGPARFQLVNGRGAWLPDDDPLATSEWLVAAELDGRVREARIILAARTERATLEADLADRIENRTGSDWDATRGTVVVRHQRRLGALVLDERIDNATDPASLQAGLLHAVRAKGLDALNWTDAARQFRARVELLRQTRQEDWPAFDEHTLLNELDAWLGPFLPGLGRWRELERLDLMPALAYRLGHERLPILNERAPTALTVPAGQRVRLDYTGESPPVLAVKLQAVFGWDATPRIADGRIPVVLHLLSPAGRPLAVTADLASFWRNAYPEVAKTMRGRYPKHPWPDDPLAATATLRTRRSGT